MDSGLWVVLLFSLLALRMICSTSYMGRPSWECFLCRVLKPRLSSSRSTSSRMMEVVTVFIFEETMVCSTAPAISSASDWAIPVSSTREETIFSRSQRLISSLE